MPPADSKGGAFGRRRHFLRAQKGKSGERRRFPAPHGPFGTLHPCGAAFLPDARAHASEEARITPF